jgi:hypothetical protein
MFIKDLKKKFFFFIKIRGIKNFINLLSLELKNNRPR